MTNPMREALEEIVRLSGHDNLLAEQAGPVVFARMGDIHQHASAALSTEWRPDPKTVEECAKVAEALFKINGKHVSPAGKAVAEAIRSLSNHPMTLIDLEQEAFCWHCPPGDEHCTCVQNGWIPPALKQAIDETRQRIRECFTRTYSEQERTADK